MKTSQIAFALFLAVVPACGKDTKKQPDKAIGPVAPSSGAARFDIAVTEKGFEPEDVAVPAGKPVTLVFERKTDETCVKEVVLELDGKKIEKDLPLNRPVELAVTFPKAGKLTYACGMDMVHGTISVQ